MLLAAAPNIDPSQVLTRREMQVVLDALHSGAKNSRQTRLNLILFRLAACCGLRVSEISGLKLADVKLEESRPYIKIQRGASKGGKSRIVPLWWDAGTLKDITDWKADRVSAGAGEGDWFLVSPRSGRETIRYSRHTLRRRFKTACKALGLDRVRSITIHHGRHTFISHALAGGRTLAEVRDAAGHANVTITSAYLHVVVEDEEVGNLFGATKPERQSK
jgi:integrase